MKTVIAFFHFIAAVGMIGLALAKFLKGEVTPGLLALAVSYLIQIYVELESKEPKFFIKLETKED